MLTHGVNSSSDIRTKMDVAKALEFCASADAAPAAPGAYLLKIDLVEPLSVRMVGKPYIELSAGRYFYCGSANGPGGLRSRLARHMRRGKSVHWHIDQLTERSAVTGAWIVRNGKECDLVAISLHSKRQYRASAVAIAPNAAATSFACPTNAHGAPAYVRLRQKNLLNFLDSYSK